MSLIRVGAKTLQDSGPPAASLDTPGLVHVYIETQWKSSVIKHKNVLCVCVFLKKASKEVSSPQC